jgi:hypothetical protein
MFLLVPFMFFSSTKPENRRAEQVLGREVGGWEMVGKGVGG